MSATKLLVGCYTRPMGHCPKASGKGVSVFRLAQSGDSVTPELLSTTEVGPNPSFLTFGPRKRLVLVCSEDGPNEGTLTVCHLSEDGAALSVLERVSSEGVDPCYVALDAPEERALVANYSSGSVLFLRLSAEGKVAHRAKVQLEGHSGVVASRQEGPHAHCAVPSADWSSVYVADLGNDRVYHFRLTDDGLVPAGPPAVLPPGTGPRHIVLHPTLPLAYVSGELTNTAHILALGPEGQPSHLGFAPTLPRGWTGESTVAELALSRDGRFLLVANRGHDSLAVLAVSADGRALSPQSHVPSGGLVPRHFAFAPDGRTVAVANQDSDNIALFRFHQDSGHLQPLDQDIATPAPVCLVFH